jgi:hypothetical protein
MTKSLENIQLFLDIQYRMFGQAVTPFLSQPRTWASALVAFRNPGIIQTGTTQNML